MQLPGSSAGTKTGSQQKSQEGTDSNEKHGKSGRIRLNEQGTDSQDFIAGKYKANHPGGPVSKPISDTESHKQS